MFKNYELLLHPTFGVLGMLAAVWVFVEALSPTPAGEARMRTAARTGAVMIWLAYITAGYYYVLYYGADKAFIKAGPWPWAHGLVMETKEHTFFLGLFLATLLPIVVGGAGLAKAAGRRRLVLWNAAGVVVLVLAMEGAGAIISMGDKLGLMSKIGV